MSAPPTQQDAEVMLIFDSTPANTRCPGNGTSSTIPSGKPPPSSSVSTAAYSEGVIDLCTTGTESSSSAHFGFSPSKRRRTVKPLPKDAAVEAVVIDATNCCRPSNSSASGSSNLSRSSTALSNSSNELDAATKYRQALGPLRFGFVSELAHHAFAKQPQNAATTTGSNKKRSSSQRLYKELVEYQLNLPIDGASAIFVRAIESRMDLLRVLITGPEGTPYANGCFLFDVHLNNYPKSSPKVQFLTTGGGTVRFNPNLYNCGKVCLSLLGTWSGPGWQPDKSTLLQVLVSIQGLILVQDPYFNEPGYETSKGSKNGTAQSEEYNHKIRLYTLRHAMRNYLNVLLPDDNSSRHPVEEKATATGRSHQRQPPKVSDTSSHYHEFFDVMRQHFLTRAPAIREQLVMWRATYKTKQSSMLAAEMDYIEKQLQRLEEIYSPGSVDLDDQHGDKLARSEKAKGSATLVDITGGDESPDKTFGSLQGGDFATSGKNSTAKKSPAVLEILD